MTHKRRNDDLISAYHDGELTAADRDLAERLLEESADSRSELDDYRALSSLLADLPRDAAPVDLRTAVMQQIASAAPSVPAVEPSRKTMPAANPSPKRSRMPRLLLLAGGLTTAAAVVFAVNMFTGGLPKAGQEVANSEAAPAGPESSARTFEANDVFLAENDRDNVGELAMPMAAGSSAPGSADVRMLEDDARPPDDALPGDIYTFFEQSNDGSVVVVDATVVDVRRAIGRVQYLLKTNSIPTVPVDAASRGFDRYYEESREGASAATPTADGDWGVYIETDADQMNVALQALNSAAIEEEELFLDFDVAGVLDALPPTTYAAQRGAGQPAGGQAAQTLGMRRNGRPGDPEVPAEAIRHDPPSTTARSRMSISGNEKALPAPTADAPRPQGDEQAPDRAKPELSAAEPAAPSLHDPAGKPGSGATENAEAPMPMPESLHRESLTNGYQQVLNFSKQEISQQLRQLDRDAPEAELRATDETQSKRLTETDAVDRPQDSAMGRLSFKEAGSSNRDARRTLRLLLVIEADPMFQWKKTDSRPTPIEAPRPRSKKG